MHWREIVQKYLAEGIKEEMEGLLRAKERRQRRFLEEVGTPELVKRLAERDSRYLELVGRRRTKLPSPDRYVLIEECDERLVVEVEEQELMASLGPSRFRLLRDGDSWRFDEIYWKCGICDKGLCPDCRGERACRFCKGQGKLRRRGNLRSRLCVLCNGSGKCSHCEGRGACTFCRDSDMPGWRSSTVYRNKADD